MLRISTHEDDKKVRLQIEGALAGSWVKELELTWRKERATLDRDNPGGHGGPLPLEADAQGRCSVPGVRTRHAGPDFRNYGLGQHSRTGATPPPVKFSRGSPLAAPRYGPSCRFFVVWRVLIVCGKFNEDEPRRDLEDWKHLRASRQLTKRNAWLRVPGSTPSVFPTRVLVIWILDWKGGEPCSA